MPILNYEQLCCFCKHWECSYEQEEQWSETTTEPSRFYIICRKGQYRRDSNTTTKQFRKLILNGKTCPDFELAKDSDES